MKKANRVLSILLAVLMVAVSLPVAIGATIVESGSCGENVTYTLDSEGTLTISGTGAMMDFSSTQSPFNNNSDIKTISIKSGVTSIGTYAFFKCSGLTAVQFPSSVSSIGGYAFCDCSSLTSITVPESVDEIQRGTFCYCTNLKSITVWPTTWLIWETAFDGCSKFTDIYFYGSQSQWNQVDFGNDIPDDYYLRSATVHYLDPNPRDVVASGSCGENVTYTLDSEGTLTLSGTGATYNFNGYLDRPTINLEVSPFAEDDRIQNVIVEQGVTSIGMNAFMFCSNLQTIQIPESVTSISREILSSSYAAGWNSCTSFQSFYVDSSNSCYSSDESGCLYNKDKTELIIYPAGNERTTFSVPNSVTTISRGVFSKCQYLKSVSLPNTITEISEEAFYGSLNLTSVTIPSTVVLIDQDAFRNCSSLSSVNIPNSVTRICDAAFYGCSSLTSVVIPNQITTLESYTFRDCSSLTSVTIPDSVTSISWYVFAECTKLTSIDIPESVSSIGSYAFRNCTGLTSIDIPEGITNISYCTFDCCNNLSSVTIPSSITTIETNAFYGCSSLTEVYYADSESKWNEITISSGNTPLTSATIYYNGQGPSTTHTVTYNYSTNGGTSATQTTATVAEGATIDLTPTATKSGWQFVGWNTDANATTALSSLNMGSSNVTLYAIFKKTLTGTFIDYSGTTKKTRTSSVTIYNKDTSGIITKPTQNTYTGWTAQGWTTQTTPGVIVESDYSQYGVPGESLAANEVRIGANTTFYGGYTRDLTLSYNANGGSPTPQSVPGTQYVNSYDLSVTEDPCFTLADAPTKSGSTFNGWAKGSLSGMKYAAGGDIQIASNTTMYATWTENPIPTHTVTYNYSTNGGTSATQTTATVAEGSAISLSPMATKSGWQFVGWNTNANATTVLSSLNMGSSNVTLYAIFKKTLTGTFIDYSGTTKKTTTKTVDIYNKATSGTLTAPTQNTYTGWTSRGWATGTSADASAVSSYSISANTTYYGLYQRTLTLSYNANGGSSTPNSQTGTQYANSYSISSTKNPTLKLANAITKSGSTFDKWAMGSASGTKYAAGASVTISANTTMYATWTSAWWIADSETYSFSNSRNSFRIQTRTVSDSDFTKLANYVKSCYSASDAAIVINWLQQVRNGEWGGSCYGMAVTAILDKLGQIDFKKNFDPDAQTIWQVDTPYKNSKVLSAINYYLIAQIIPFIKTTEYYRTESSWKAGIKKLIQNAQAGKLMMFGFGFTSDGKSYGHEIVIKGYRQNADGSYTLITWDNNHPGINDGIYVKSDFSDLWICNPETYEKYYGDLSNFHFYTDFSMFDYIDIDGPNNDMNIRLNNFSAESSETFIKVTVNGNINIENASGQTLTVTPEGTSGTMPVLSKRLFVSSTTDGNPAPLELIIEVNDSKSFTFESTEDDIDISVQSDKMFARAATTNADTVIIGEDEGVYMLGDNISYSANLSLNNDFCDMVEIEGVTRGDAKVLYNDESVQVVGAQKEENTLTVYDNVTDVQSYAFSSSYSDMLVTNNSKGDVVVLGADSSGDFTYAIMGEADNQPHTHSYNSTVTKQPTCTEAGVRTYTCVNGDSTYTEAIPALGHIDTNNDGECDRCKEKLSAEPTTLTNACKWCGKVHEGFFQKIVGFFHNILASILGAKFNTDGTPINK